MGLNAALSLVWQSAPNITLLGALIAGAVLMPAQEPVPIAGGDDLGPPVGVIHNYAIGPTNLTFEGIPLDGLNFEPNGITNFRGQVTQSYLIGTATASDAHYYDLASDIRVFRGEYIDTHGVHRHGTFVFI